MEDVTTDFLKGLILKQSRGVTTRKEKWQVHVVKTEETADLQESFLWIRFLPFFSNVYSNFVQKSPLSFLFIWTLSTKVLISDFNIETTTIVRCCWILQLSITSFNV